jgi:hypothetical protein
LLHGYQKYYISATCPKRQVFLWNAYKIIKNNHNLREYGILTRANSPKGGDAKPTDLKLKATVAGLPGKFPGLLSDPLSFVLENKKATCPKRRVF